MGLRRSAYFAFAFLASYHSGHVCVVTGQGKDPVQSNNIPPETAREMAELKEILIDRPSDPAALFSRAMDYATIGDKTKANRVA